jgi:FlaG/FlaF family flagellin (archaellin)
MTDETPDDGVQPPDLTNVQWAIAGTVIGLIIVLVGGFATGSFLFIPDSENTTEPDPQADGPVRSATLTLNETADAVTIDYAGSFPPDVSKLTVDKNGEQIRSYPINQTPMPAQHVELRSLTTGDTITVYMHTDDGRQLIDNTTVSKPLPA